jgi:hypothetical protein
MSSTQNIWQQDVRSARGRECRLHGGFQGSADRQIMAGCGSLRWAFQCPQPPITKYWVIG